MHSLYTNLDRVRRYQSIASGNTNDDRELLRMISRASRSIDRYTRRRFSPVRATRFYDYRYARILNLDDDLLVLDTLKTMNGASTIASPVWITQTGDNYNRPPYNQIVLKFNSGNLFLFSGTDQKANEVTGYWGYHEAYETDAWVATGTSISTSYVAGSHIMVLNGPITGTGASDENWESPRVSVGDTLKVEDEFFIVQDTSGAASLKISSAQNGTSANNHPVNAAVYRYYPEPDIQWATERLTAWLYGQAETPYESKTANVNFGIITIPQGIATDVLDKLDRFRRPTIIVYPSEHPRDYVTTLVY